MLYLSLPPISYLAFFVVKNRERQSAAPIVGNRGGERIFIHAGEKICWHFSFHLAQKFRHPVFISSIKSSETVKKSIFRRYSRDGMHHVAQKLTSRGLPPGLRSCLMRASSICVTRDRFAVRGFVSAGDFCAGFFVWAREFTK